MNQETNQFDHPVDQEVNIDSSSEANAHKEEKKYAFNQAEVNQDNHGYASQNNTTSEAAPQQEYNHDGGYVNNLHKEDMGQNQNQNSSYDEYKKANGSANQGSIFSSFSLERKIPEIKTDEDARNAYYGINQPYYKKAFQKYKEGKVFSWNWCAFLFRSHWLFSRKMYVIGTLYSLMMTFITVSMNQIIFMNQEMAKTQAELLAQVTERVSDPAVQAMLLPWMFIFIGLWIATGLFANYVYISHMENKIIYPSDHDSDRKKITQNIILRGGFSIYGIMLSILVSDVLGTLVQSLTLR